jgi:hypothetical protein
MFIVSLSQQISILSVVSLSLLSLILLQGSVSAVKNSKHI